MEHSLEDTAGPSLALPVAIAFFISTMSSSSSLWSDDMAYYSPVNSDASRMQNRWRRLGQGLCGVAKRRSGARNVESERTVRKQTRYAGVC